MPIIKIDYATLPDDTHSPSFIQFLNQAPKNEYGCGYLSKGDYYRRPSNGYIPSTNDVSWHLTENMLFNKQGENCYQCYLIGTEVQEAIDENGDPNSNKGHPKLNKLGSGGFSTVYNLKQIVSLSNVAFKQADSQFVLKVQSHCDCPSILWDEKTPCEIKHSPVRQSQLEYELTKQVTHLEPQLFYYSRDLNLSYIIEKKLYERDLFDLLYVEELQFTLAARRRLTANFMKTMDEQISGYGFIAHNDIKVENLMVTPSLECYLCDYANASRNMDPTPILGTVQAMAPELFKQYFDTGGLYIPNEKIDVWAAAIVLWQIWGGVPNDPTDGQPTVPTAKQGAAHKKYLQETIPREVAESKYFSTLPQGEIPSPELQKKISSLLSNMFKVNPVERFTFKQAIAETKNIFPEFFPDPKLCEKSPSSPEKKLTTHTDSVAMIAPLSLIGASIKPLSATAEPFAPNKNRLKISPRSPSSTASLQFFKGVPNVKKTTYLESQCRIPLLAPLPLVPLNTIPVRSTLIDEKPIKFRHKLYSSKPRPSVLTTIEEQQTTDPAALSSASSRIGA